MLGKTILFHANDKKGPRRVVAALRAAGNDVLEVGSAGAACELLEARAVDLAILEYQTSPELQRVLRAANGRVPVVALSSEPDPAVLLDAVCDWGLTNLLSRSAAGGLEEVDAREVVITAEKILRQDIFGIGKYLPGFGVEIHSARVMSASDRDDVVGYVEEYLKTLGAGRDLATAMGAVADELVTNAVYNAPRDGEGRAKYAATNRRDKVELLPTEQVDVRFGSDGQQFVLSVSDRFGALSPEHIRSGLRRCLGSGDQIAQKAGGAGIGLYQVLYSTTQLVINVSEGHRTEVIALVDITRRMKGVRQGGHSLHLFLDRPRVAAPSVSDAVPLSNIEISDSMRIDLQSRLGIDRKPQPVIPLFRRKRRAAPPPPSGPEEPDVEVLEDDGGPTRVDEDTTQRYVLAP